MPQLCEALKLTRHYAFAAAFLMVSSKSIYTHIATYPYSKREREIMNNTLAAWNIYLAKFEYGYPSLNLTHYNCSHHIHREPKINRLFRVGSIVAIVMYSVTIYSMQSNAEQCNFFGNVHWAQLYQSNLVEFNIMPSVCKFCTRSPECAPYRCSCKLISSSLWARAPDSSHSKCVEHPALSH